MRSVATSISNVPASSQSLVTPSGFTSSPWRGNDLNVAPHARARATDDHAVAEDRLVVVEQSIRVLEAELDETLRARQLALSQYSASRPLKDALSHPTAKPSPASSGVSSSVMSWPQWR